MKVTLHEIESDCSTGSLATGLLKTIKGHGFLKTRYLLKYMLPNLWALKKTFAARSLNFSRTIPSINRCKTKIQKIEKNGKVSDKQNDLGGQLKSLNITFTDIQENIIKSPVGKYASSICQSIYADSHPIHVKYSQYSRSLMRIYFQLNTLLLSAFMEMKKYLV